MPLQIIHLSCTASIKAPQKRGDRLVAVIAFRYSEVLNRFPSQMFAKSVLLVLLATSALVNSFPDGAPADACTRNNRPKHGKTQPKALQTSPYQLVASADEFGPGAEVQGG